MTDDNVVFFDGITRLDTPAERVIGTLSDCKWGQIVIVGFDVDGGFHFRSNIAGSGDTLWLLERAKHKLMLITDDLENEND